MQIAPAREGAYSGLIQLGPEQFPFEARLETGKLHGTFKSSGNNFKFTASLEGNVLTLMSDGASYRLTRRDPKTNPLVETATLAQSAPPIIAVPPLLHGSNAPPGSGSARMGVINGQRLTTEQLRTADRGTNRIPDGKYWYDRVSGAWGWEGGPCSGFIEPGLELGGPLKEDASGGRTGVFVNGRQLHFIDVAALQQFVQVMPGRYWVDAQGNFGYEGGPAVGNLVRLAQAAVAAGGGRGSPAPDCPRRLRSRLRCAGSTSRIANEPVVRRIP